jgi:hypothetical protein
MKTITVKAARKIQSSLGGYYNKGELIKTINLDNVERVTCKGSDGDITIYYHNGLHEVLNGNAVDIEFNL